MPAEPTWALILKLVEFSETSLVVTLFTRDFGKVTALAKGARRIKGPFESALDLLALCRVMLLRKSSDVLDLLTEAKLQRRFRGRGRDLGAYYAGYYVAELLLELTDDDDPHPELFDAAEETLAALGGGPPIPLLIFRFELTALRLLGHLPNLVTCVECGQTIEPVGRVAFGLLDGGVLCRACRPGRTHVVSLGAQTLRAWRALCECASTAPPAEAGRRELGELRGVMNRYLSHLVGRPLSLHRWLPAMPVAATPNDGPATLAGPPADHAAQQTAAEVRPIVSDR